MAIGGVRPSYGAGLLIIRPGDGKVLLVRRSAMVSMPGRWGTPGGGEEPGETPDETAFREATEELGSLPAIEKIRHEGYWHANGPYFAFATFPALLLDGQEAWEPTLNPENDAWGWFDPKDLPQPMLPGGIAAIRALTPWGRWKPPHMGIVAAKTFTVCKVVLMDEKAPAFLSVGLTVHDEQTGRTLQMAIPFHDRFPAGIVLPSCKRADIGLIRHHYENLLAQDPAYVLACMEGLAEEDIVAFALAEIRAKAKKDVADTLDRALSEAVVECLR